MKRKYIVYYTSITNKTEYYLLNILRPSYLPKSTIKCIERIM